MASATIKLDEDEAGKVLISIEFSDPGLSIEHPSHVIALSMLQYARTVGEEGEENG